MQEQGERYRTPLVDVVSMFSEQSCARPYDSVFGLLGVTRAQIPVSYDMPLLELYLRATVQCLLELVSSDEGEKDTSRVPFDILKYRAFNFSAMPFLDALLHALNLPRYDATVCAVTQEALELCKHPRSYSYFHKVAETLNGRFRPSRIIPWHHRQIMKTKFRKARNKNAPMPNPCNREDVRRHSEWCTFVMAIYLDVLARMWENDDEFRSWAMEQDHLVASMTLKSKLKGPIESDLIMLEQLRN